LVSPFSLSGVQRKIKVGEANDPAEHEANHVAQHVTSSAPSPPVISRLPSIQRLSHDKSSTDEPVRRAASSDSSAGMETAAARAIGTKGPGEPLRPHVRQELESRMGADLSGTRVHEGPAAQDSAAALNARAFTHQGDIFLGRGESQDNVQLMAHEATHVVQQGAALQVSAPAPPDAAAATTPATAPISVASGSSPAPSGSSAAAASTKPADGTPSKPTTEKAGKQSTGAGPSAGADAAADDKRAETSPAADPAFATVTGHVKTAAAQQKTHEPIGVKVAAAHAAVNNGESEIHGRAAANQTEAVAKPVPQPFNRAAFEKALHDKIKAPTNLEEADDFKTNNNLASVKADLNTTVASAKETSGNGLPEAAATPPKTDGIEATAHTDLAEPDAGAAPKVSAAGAAPKAASEQDISLQAGPKALDRQMADAQVTDEQLRDSNEPEFQSALAQKRDVQTQSVGAPKAYRLDEVKLLHAGQADAQSVAGKGLLGIHGVRKGAFGGVHGDQSAAKAEEEKRRAQIFSDVENFYKEAQGKVEERLKKLDTDVNTTFDQGAESNQAQFETYVAFHMDKYKDDRYGGLGGGVLWAKDKLVGLPDDVNVFYQRGHDLYVERMDALIGQIAIMVETGLNEAKAAADAGQDKVHDYVQKLSKAEQETGKQAETGIQTKFNALQQSITDKQGELVDSLAKKYTDNLKKVNDRIEEMKEENSGLVHKVAGAIKGVIVAIGHLKDLLLNVLSRAASAIGLIIAHPISFLGHLVDAGILGFNNFKDHILEHLKEGFMQWLFGAVAATGIQLPKSFDLAGILDLVLQVLGLTYPNIRARAVNIVGERVVKTLETGAEIFKVLFTKGPAGLWEYIKEKLSDVLGTVIDKIKSFIMEKVIIAGITWIIGLLNPASAFIKACKAIYDIVMFFVEHGSQILDLVNAIIDSITAIASGQIGQAAAFIEKSLARAIPVIIGFLAGLLGVGGISEKIKEVIDSIRKPINEAIDWVIHKVVGLVKAAGGLLGFGKKPDDDKPDERTPGKKAADLDSAMAEANKLADQPDATAESVTAGLVPIKQKYRMNILELDPESGDEYEIVGEINPRKEKKVELPPGEVKSAEPVYGPVSGTLGGTSMVVHGLSAKHKDGSKPSASPGVWDSVKPEVHTRQGVGLYVRGHLLNQQLGGPGTEENLTPITYSANSNHLNSVEKVLKAMINTSKKKQRLVHYEVAVAPPSRAAASGDLLPAERQLTRGLKWSWHQLRATGEAKSPKLEKLPGGESDSGFVDNVGGDNFPHI
jgi:Domain of unknown function (DUF4157)/DNA/RNA non-specific endonuclease